MGGDNDNSNAGATWVFSRSSGGVWTQQGSKLVGTGADGNADQGISVALSSDGNTAIVGGRADNASFGAAWVFTRSGSVWTQQGSKLIGTGAVGSAHQAYSVALSSDGNTAIVGGFGDNSSVGAVWIYTRSGGVWTQQGSKLVGTGAVGNADQGASVALSADGNTAIVGGVQDNGSIGAAWVFVQMPAGALAVSPNMPLNLHGPVGGPFASDMSGQYTLTNTGSAALDYSISPPSWLTVSPSSSGSLTAGASASVIVFPGPLALGASAGNYSSSIIINNTTNGSGNTTVVTNLLVNQSPGGRLGGNDQPLPIEGAGFNGPTLPLTPGQ